MEARLNRLPFFIQINFSQKEIQRLILVTTLLGQQNSI